ncbi:hypothetical protein KM043_011572 [Ampulex compressa]|nr:hypothetical protein KM043_011572 [Ampulex compressa]
MDCGSSVKVTDNIVIGKVAEERARTACRGDNGGDNGGDREKASSPKPPITNYPVPLLQDRSHPQDGPQQPGTP